MATITIIKASGEKELFNEHKLRKSLVNAGATKEIIYDIIGSIQDILYDGISTQTIYKEAFRLLRNNSNGSATRYNLKQAILELGPTGYPFEKFVGELLNRLGYKTQTGVIVEGDCVSHEIDVIAEKDDDHFMIECKFHNRKGHKCNVKIPLYIQSRFKDVEKNWRKLPNHEHKFHRGWVVTNTRFTKDALQYGSCVGLKLLSWDYPKNEGLKDLINRINLHPITCLTSLQKKEKQALLNHDIVFCKQIYENKEVLNELKMNQRQQKKVLNEVNDICNINTQK